MAEAEFTPDCSDGDFHRKIADGGVDRVYGGEKHKNKTTTTSVLKRSYSPRCPRDSGK